jgi:demethylmenaquinone methyltransferase/2-methoxy-6-polyprenyl-1,4-benzoquinol methylase
MFSAIAHRYDLLNHLLSLNIDKLWRRKAVAQLTRFFTHRDVRCLDLCCGTGDLALTMIRKGINQVVACDFSHPMLQLSHKKISKAKMNGRIQIIEADGLRLPFRSQLFDAVAIAFGLRNLENVQDGLLEIHRVLKPTGQLVVLEFSKPTNALFDKVFQFYFFQILPRVGNILSKHDHAYSYLPRSVSQFPDQKELAAIISRCGFEKVSYVNLSGGIAAIHRGQKQIPEQNRVDAEGKVDLFPAALKQLPS